MKVRMKGLLALLVFLGLTWAGVTYSHQTLYQPLQTSETQQEPLIILTNGNGERTGAFRVMDTVYGSFSGLLPDAEYIIRVMRSDEKEISYCIHPSDKKGIIPTVALWWDIGAVYENSREGRLDTDTLYSYTYSCLLLHREEKVAEVPIKIMTMEETGPMIYASNDKGDPLNIFEPGKESVYVSGKNFPKGANVHIHVVNDRHSWEIGDTIDGAAKDSKMVKLDKSQEDFTTQIAYKTDLDVGTYDLVIEYDTVNGIIDQQDVVDSVYHVGFTISRLRAYPIPPPEPHVEAELACQAPPRDPVTGIVIGAPNPIYKDHFGASEEVWMAVNPNTGGHDYSNQNARLYVVYHRTEANWWDGLALVDVSGGYETTTVQPGCANFNYTRIWINPTVRDAGYDVVVDFAPFGVYDRGYDIVDSLDAKGFVVPTLWVCLDSISYNHNTGSNNTDAMNIRKNYSEDVPVPEWVKAEETHPAAYIKDKTITVKAVFSAGSGVTSAKIRAVTYYGLLGDAPQITVSFSGGTSGPVSFQISGLTPNQVRYYPQRWKWYCEDVNGSGSAEVHLGDSINKIYYVLAQPQSPWTTSGTTEPWADVLYYTCWWASGQTTPEGAADKVARRLFLYNGGLYDTYSGAPRYTNTGYGGTFYLTNFLGNMPDIGIVNCYDMGKSLVTFSNVVGGGLTYRFSGPFGYLNCIYAIGRGWTNNPFYDNPMCDPNPIVPEDWGWAQGRSSFGNHAFGSISDNIFDACLTVDTDSNPDYGPPFTETWMLDEPWNGYKTKVVDDNPPTNTAYPSTYTFTIN
jgi:hypothetical protein